MWSFLEQLLETCITVIQDLSGLVDWYWDAIISLFNAFGTFSALIPSYFTLYLPAGLAAIFATLVGLSIVMAVMSVFGSNVRR